MKNQTSKQILGKQILELLSRYADNRDHQCERTWDKQHDLDLIFESWLESGECRSVEAIAGSFIFNEKGKRPIYCYAKVNPVPKFIRLRKDGSYNLNQLWEDL